MKRPAMEIGPHVMINVENRLLSEMTKSLGSLSSSTTMTTHKVRLHPVGALSKSQGHWEPGGDVLMLRSVSCFMSPKVENLQSSVSSTH